MIRPPPRSPLFPNTPLSQSKTAAKTNRKTVMSMRNAQLQREPAGRFTVGGIGVERSEEHTSELQSQSNLVCRLLLEKKKKKNISYCVCRFPTYRILARRCSP